jgi:23S rRNA pseudouridine1911/1915/1917 synthase
MRFVAERDAALIDLLQTRFPDASRSTLRRMLQHRRVTLDGRGVVRADAPVGAGQMIEVADARAIEVEPPGRVLLRDPHLIAVEKPAGILSVARDPETDDTFYRRVNDYVQASSGGRERIFIVHRLDRVASGIMLFALSPQIQERLQRNWATTEKCYWALVEGRPPEDAGTIRGWLRENRAHRVYASPEGPEAKYAVTHYRVRRSGVERSLLDVQIETGRKNQIRVHLAGLGCPIVGDRAYGARTNPIHRLGLHAYALTFTHPATLARVRLRLPLPKAFRIA